MNKTYICPHCKSKDLTFEAHAKWDEKEQAFKYHLNKYYFDANQAYCEVCDNWVETEVEE